MIVNWQQEQGYPGTGFFSNSEVSKLLNATARQQAVAQAPPPFGKTISTSVSKNSPALSNNSGEDNSASSVAATGVIPTSVDAVPVATGPWAVKSAAVIHDNLQIALRNGRVITLPREEGQCSFDDLQIAPDDITVGWTDGGDAEVEGSPACAPGNQYVGGGPVIWRGGKVIRRIDEGGAFISWSFQGKGTMVAVHAGPAHFDTEQRWDLYSISTGKMLKEWGCSDKKPPPDWASDEECSP